MSNLFVKDTDEKLTFGVDWSVYLANENNGAGDSIAASVWDVPAGLTNEGESIDGTVCLVQVSGGVAGVEYELRNQITQTVAGDTPAVSIYVRVL